MTSEPTIRWYRDRSASMEALSNLFVAVARPLIDSGSEDQAENCLQLASESCPDDVALALRVAHLYCFNAPRKYFEASTRYAFVRRGLLEIMESFDRSEKKVDHLWLLGSIVARKVADPLYEHDRLRPLFIADQELQQRIQRITGFQQTDKAWNPEPDVVAEHILTAAIGMQESSRDAGMVPEIVLYSERAFASARVAQSLMRSGQSVEAAAQWTRAKDFYVETADKPLIRFDTQKYRLLDLFQIRKQEPKESPVAERIELEYDRTECTLGFAICDVGKDSDMCDAMNLFCDANSETRPPTEALNLYEDAFLKLDKAFTKTAERVAVAQLIAPEWQAYEFLSRKTHRQPNDARHVILEMQELQNSYSQNRMSRLQTLIQDDEPNRH